MDTCHAQKTGPVKEACSPACLSNRWPLLGLRDSRALGSVLGPALFPIRDTGCIERAAYDMIADARQVFDTAAADQDHTVFLQVVTDSRDIRINLVLISKTDTRDLAER